MSNETSNYSERTEDKESVHLMSSKLKFIFSQSSLNFGEKKLKIDKKNSWRHYAIFSIGQIVLKLFQKVCKIDEKRINPSITYEVRFTFFTLVNLK